MKYLIYMNKKYGIETPLIFPKFLNHKEVANKIDSSNIPISAGFCDVIDNKFKAHGRSQSLNISSREQDSRLLNLMMK